MRTLSVMYYGQFLLQKNL